MLRSLPVFALLVSLGVHLESASAAECIAHRGDSIRHPDNSLAAIRSAWKAGADVVEVDVRMLHDKTLVLFHDAHHEKAPIFQFSYAAFSKRVGGEGVPTLKQGLAEVASGKTLLLDLKEDSPEFLDRVLAQCAASTISGTRVELQGNNLKGLRYLRQKAAPGTPLYYVTDLKPGGQWAKAEPLALQLSELGLQGVTAKGRQMVDAAYVKAFHSRGLKYFVWTINDPERIKHYVDLGVDGVITDDPVTFRKIAPAKAPAKKLPLAGEVFEVKGRTAFIIRPTKKVVGKAPWVWYAPTLPRLPAEQEVWMFKQWLERGIAIAGIDVGESYGSPDGRKLYQALYDELTMRRGMGKKPCLLARSRGGLMLYSWAAENPDKVSGIAGIYPVCNLTSYPGLKKACGAYRMTAQELGEKLVEHNPVERLGPLAKAGVPILHLHGDNDKVVPLEANSGMVKERYDKLGGTMTLELIPGGGHDVKRHWFESEKLVEFVSGVLVGREAKWKDWPVVAKRKAELDRIVIPSVRFKDFRIEEAIGFAISRSAEVEVLPKTKIVSITVRFPNGEFYQDFRRGAEGAYQKDIIDQRINLRKRNITLSDLLVECAKQVNMDLYTTSSGVVFCPSGSKPYPNGAADKGEVWEELYRATEEK